MKEMRGLKNNEFELGKTSKNHKMKGFSVPLFGTEKYTMGHNKTLM